MSLCTCHSFNINCIFNEKIKNKKCVDELILYSIVKARADYSSEHQPVGLNQTLVRLQVFIKCNN